MNQKAISLPLVLIGVLLIVVGCVVAVVNLGMTVDQINSADSMNQIFGDYFLRYGLAFLFASIGAVIVGIGLKR
ncbi:MAG: hypothetical protein NWE93_12800 [Candidatus Bathyarchaeota archaeon]|nr:hypothetical protein [Candidatus Bathyarchaeota archaeon]